MTEISRFLEYKSTIKVWYDHAHESQTHYIHVCYFVFFVLFLFDIF